MHTSTYTSCSDFPGRSRNGLHRDKSLGNCIFMGPSWDLGCRSAVRLRLAFVCWADCFDDCASTIMHSQIGGTGTVSGTARCCALLVAVLERGSWWQEVENRQPGSGPSKPATSSRGRCFLYLDLFLFLDQFTIERFYQSNVLLLGATPMRNG